jgi:hypothetical protein
LTGIQEVHGFRIRPARAEHQGGFRFPLHQTFGKCAKLSAAQNRSGTATTQECARKKATGPMVTIANGPNGSTDTRTDPNLSDFTAGHPQACDRSCRDI